MSGKMEAVVDTTSHAQSAGGLKPHSSRSFRTFRKVSAVSAVALSDLVAFAIAYLLLRQHHGIPQLMFFAGTSARSATTPLDVFVLLAPAFVAVRYTMGDYTKRQLFWDGARTTTTALLLTSLVDLLLMAMGGVHSAFWVLASWAFLIVELPVLRLLTRMVSARAGLWQTSTVLIGDGERIQSALTALGGSSSLGFDVRWIALEDATAKIPDSLSHISVLYAPDPTEMATRLQELGCDQAVLASRNVQSEFTTDLIQRLLEADISVAIVPSLQKLPLVGVNTSYFFGRDILLLQVRNNFGRMPQRFLKRAFDMLGSLALLILFALPLSIIAAMVMLHDGGPAFYRQKRIGRNGRAFFCLKFRSMAVDADERLQCWRKDNPLLYEEYLRTFKLRDDPRITGLGKWLRKTSLDELPQLLNVLVGDMSLVGPRPVVEQELRDYYGHAAQLYIRVRPGITGMWQVSGRSDTSYQERVVYDEWYILNWSFWYDVVILIQTAVIVVTGKGAF